MKRYSTFSRALGLEPHHLIVWCHTRRFVVERRLTPLHRCTRCIVHPQPNRLRRMNKNRHEIGTRMLFYHKEHRRNEKFCTFFFCHLRERLCIFDVEMLESCETYRKKESGSYGERKWKKGRQTFTLTKKSCIDFWRQMMLLWCDFFTGVWVTASHIRYPGLFSYFLFQ